MRTAIGAFLLLLLTSVASGFAPLSSSTNSVRSSQQTRPQRNQPSALSVFRFGSPTNVASPTRSTTPDVTSPYGKQESVLSVPLVEEKKDESDEYRQGFLIIAFITFLNASVSPAWHAAFCGSTTHLPPLLLNAAVSVVAWGGLLAGGSLLDSKVDSMSNLAVQGSAAENERDAFTGLPKAWRGGGELGVYKFLGTTGHLYGCSLTTANHAAFLLQLTTLIVPVIQGLQGERIPKQIQMAVGLALAGVFIFTQDPNAVSDVDPAQQTLGDALCVGGALFYSLYDIQTFKWGRQVPRKDLVTIKIGSQAVLSCLLCAVLAGTDSMEYLQNAVAAMTTTSSDGGSLAGGMGLLIPVVLWSGLIVNALATFLQVGGMQAVGPTRAQTIFASQPLWAALLSYFFLGEQLGVQGAVGGTAFLGALYLAATAEAPVPAAAKKQ